MVNELPIRSALKSLMLFLTINYCLVKKESKYVKLKIIMFARCSIREQKATKRIYFAALVGNDSLPTLPTGYQRLYQKCFIYIEIAIENMK